MAQEPLGLATGRLLSSCFFLFSAFHRTSVWKGAPPWCANKVSGRACDVTLARTRSTFMIDLGFEPRPLGFLSIALSMLWVSPSLASFPSPGNTSHSWALSCRLRIRTFCGGYVSLACCGLTVFSILLESSLSAHPPGLRLRPKVMPPVVWRRSGV